MSGTSTTTWPRRAIGLAVVWLLVFGLMVVTLWPDTPRTVGKWLALLALGPPLYLLAEFFFGWLFSQQHGQAISKRKLSPVRIVVALVVVVLYSLGLFWVLKWLSAP
jgi:hypothetical protein